MRQRIFRLLLGLTVLGFLACSDPCTRTLRSSTRSPDGQLRADVYLDDCGATTDFTSGIIVRGSDHDTKKPPRYDIGIQRGRAPRIEDGGPDLRVKWSGDSLLYVYFDSVAAIGPRPSHVGGVQIRYAPYGLVGAPLRGPDLGVDSSISQPRIDTLEDVYVVRLPYDIAGLLKDSLPRFTPFPQANYPIQFAAAHGAPLSVVLGDFNGDSATDVAMLGRSDNMFALIILLAKSVKTQQARLMYALKLPTSRPGDLRGFYLERVGAHTPIHSNGGNTRINLPTDALRVSSDTAFIVYYLKGNEVRHVPVVRGEERSASATVVPN